MVKSFDALVIGSDPSGYVAAIRAAVVEFDELGDVTGAPCLAHEASHEAISWVEKIANFVGAHPVDKSRVPGCTYSRPQIAPMGISEAKANERKLDIKMRRFPFPSNGKAIAVAISLEATLAADGRAIHI